MVRSGTTLLQSILDGHPELLVFLGDSHYFDNFLPVARNETKARRTELAEEIFFAPYWGSDHYTDLYLPDVPFDKVHANFSKRLAASEGRLRDYFLSVVLAYGEESGQLTEKTRYWVEKTPGNERFVDQIFSWWPNARCIHTVRDPRAVYDTLSRRSQKSGNTLRLGSYSHHWRRTAGSAHRHQQKYGSDRYLVVRYEDVTQDNERVVGQIREFLDIEDHPNLSNVTKTGGQVMWKGNSSRPVNFEGSVSTGSIDYWRDSLDEQSLRKLEMLLRKHMQLHNYQPESEYAFSQEPTVIYDRLVASVRKMQSAVVDKQLPLIEPE